ncbi:MAG: hypothetical protein Q8Q14_08265 [Gemmatimonadales bacterium]|nr:hypothetical protein [Gemmatimonadales bacterium]
MDGRRLYLAVAACAVVVHLGALWNDFVMDDRYIIVFNPLVHSLDGLWRTFTMPYWPPEMGGKMYRPLAIATYVLDWRVGGPTWFHAVNLLWHAAATVAVTALARRWSGAAAALAAGMLFAVHPVHVEAVANVVGRAELMAAAFTCLAVYAGVVRQSVGWSVLAMTGGMLSKENAAVAPALIAWAWALGLARPTRPKLLAFVASWVVLGAAYAAARGVILAPYARYENVAPVFVGAGQAAVRLTGVAALADVARLVVFPLTLRADYSPAERTIVASLVEPRFVVGLACFAVWTALLIFAWRRGRRIEAFGLGWIGIAFLPVANILFPVGVVIAERTLYLPSVGLVLALGAWLGSLNARAYGALLAGVVIAGGVRSAVRVPVWRSDVAVTLSILEDSPRSYAGPARTGALLLASGEPEKALAALQVAIGIFDRGHSTYVAGAAAAFASGHPDLAHEYMRRADQLCVGCPGGYRAEASAARARGDSATADSLVAHARQLEAQ